MSKTFHALVPVKETSSAKQRLAPVLDGAQRAQLVQCMLRDVLAALAKAPSIASITVLSRDPDLATLAGTLGAKLIREPQDHDLRESVLWGTRQLAADIKTDILVIAGDLPHANADAIEQLLERQVDTNTVSIITDADNQGTNALAFHYDPDMRFFFGENSAQLHEREGERLQRQVIRFAIDRLSLDLDTPADLERVAQAEIDCHTRRWLDAINGEQNTAHSALG